MLPTVPRLMLGRDQTPAPNRYIAHIAHIIFHRRLSTYRLPGLPRSVFLATS